jgi:hypothetical protein|tara:strand:- start:34 stop:378 length:345 start_codon:yes stop_codon:yes gene_type:complete
MHHEWIIDSTTGEFLYSAPGDDVTYDLSPTEARVEPERRPDPRTEKWDDGIVQKSAADVAEADAAFILESAINSYAADPLTDALVSVIAELVEQPHDDIKQKVIDALVADDEEA